MNIFIHSKVTHIKNLFLLKHRINAKERRRMTTMEIAIVMAALLTEVFLMLIIMQVLVETSDFIFIF